MTTHNPKGGQGENRHTDHHHSTSGNHHGPAGSCRRAPKGISLDGTVGNAGALDLPGPDYDIRAEYGQQAGSNLFHSFQQFNIHSDESATFSGPDSVKNIISRVTGGSASWIDGRLGSAIPGQICTC